MGPPTRKAWDDVRALWLDAPMPPRYRESMSKALPVRVTVSMGARHVPLEQVKDSRIATALGAAALDIGTKLGAIECPTHKKTATMVRVHFDPKGNADLQYESCCEALGRAIGAKLG